MNTEEREENQPRPRKVIPSIRRENTEQESERRPYNQGNVSRPDSDNYERRSFNRPQQDNRDGYRSFEDKRNTYGDQYTHRDHNREGGYTSQNRDNNYNRPSYNNDRPAYNNDRPSYNNDRPAYNNNRPSYNNDRPSYNNNRPSYTNDRPAYNNNRPSYNNDRPAYNNNRPAYGNDRSYGNDDQQRPFDRPVRQGGYDDRPARPYPASPSGESLADGLKKRRPRVGDARASSYDNNSYGGGGRPSYGDNRGGGSSYGNNDRRPMVRPRTPDYNPNAKYSLQKQLKYKEVLADPNEPIRLNKFLSNAGVCSRREADEFIQKGSVKVNGEVITELGTKITRADLVLFHEKAVQIESKVYIVLNKPKNTVTTSEDPQDRKTVMDLVRNACQERIYPVGRLDRNTTGVLLLTNDGDLASKLTHPSFKKKKIYHVWLDKNVAIEDMEKIANGMELEDGEIHADAISYASEDDKSQVGIEIHSGRNRIVRRIFESLGYHVMKLDRVYFAGLTKKNLQRGRWRYLTEREVNALRMGAFE